VGADAVLAAFHLPLGQHTITEAKAFSPIVA
jgi:hypothetical protein